MKVINWIFTVIDVTFVPLSEWSKKWDPFPNAACLRGGARQRNETEENGITRLYKPSPSKSTYQYNIIQKTYDFTMFVQGLWKKKLKSNLLQISSVVERKKCLWIRSKFQQILQSLVKNNAKLERD